MADSNGNGEVEISWAHGIGTRDGTLTKDALMVNCFAEKTDTGVAIVKRPGFVYISTITGVAAGQFSYKVTDYIIVNDTCYFAGSAGGTGIPIPAPTVGNQAYWAISAQETNAPQTLLQDESGILWFFNGTTAVKVTDSNYNSAQVAPGMAYLDGVYYAMRIDGQVIGSAINDGTTWPALSFVQADVTYGGGVTLIRHLNYILAFYQKGLQVYWDGDAAPNGQGIALLPVLSASYRTGCVNARTAVEVADMCFFLAQTSEFGRTIQMLQGLQLQSVSTPFVEKILNQMTLDEVASTSLWAFGINTCGHQFYVLTIVPMNVTLVYDLTTGLWQTWSSIVGGVEQYFTGRFYWSGATGGAGDRLQDVSTGRQMQLLTTQYTDATGAILVKARTPPMDWGTMNWKRFAAMFFFADQIATQIAISYSDDDYQTFSTARDVSLQYPRKQLRNCGSSRRRAWMLTHEDNTPLRVYSVKVPTAVATR